MRPPSQPEDPETALLAPGLALPSRGAQAGPHGGPFSRAGAEAVGPSSTSPGEAGIWGCQELRG